MGFDLKQDDWKKESRERVEEALKCASRFHGTMQTKDNIAALEAVKAELQNPSQDSRKDYVNGSNE